MADNPFSALDDQALEASLLKLARGERDSGADIILHLLVVKQRRLYLPAGADSLFSYCTDKLGFSRATAYRRKAVVDKAEEFPELVTRLRDGRLQLCAAAALAPHLTPESGTELLDAALGLSHREVETLLLKRAATLAAASPEKPALVGGLKFDAGVREDASLAGEAGEGAVSPKPKAPAPVKAAGPRTVIKPLTATSSRVNVTLHEATLERFTRAKELLGGKSDDEVLARAFDALLDKLAPERRQAKREARRAKRAARVAAGKAKRDARAKPKVSSRRGPAAERDQAMVRGNSQCSFIGKDGRRCRARTFIQLDHDRPWALGGASDALNQQPMCASHNHYLAERTFGPWTGS